MKRENQEFPRHDQEKFVSGLWSCSRQALAVGLIYSLLPLGIGDLYAQQAPPPPPPDQQYQYQQAPPQQYQQAPPPDQQYQQAPDQQYQQAPPQYQQAPPPDQQYQQAPPPPDEGLDNGGPPPQQYNALNPDQLNQLVAPVALYPDALVAQVLAASTFPTQIVQADRWVQSYPGVPPDQLAQMADSMPWDPSVKALVAFPSILSEMDRNLNWATQLGNAYYNQPQDVMAAVQNMRQAAYQAGNLRSSPQEYVTYAPGDIVIAPASPAVVYVPYYNPWIVYGPVIHPWYGYYVAPPPRGLVLGAFGVGFGVGIAIGAFGHWGWGWGHWGFDWHAHSLMFNHAVFVSRSFTVVNHGYYGRFDRNPAARAYNRNLAMHSVAYNRAGFGRGPVGGFNRGPVGGYHGAPAYRAPAGGYHGANNFRGGANYRSGGPAGHYQGGHEGGGHPENHGGGHENHGGGHENHGGGHEDGHGR